MTSRRRRGFSFTDLLAILVIICLITPMLFSAGGLMKARETANRVKCASNMRQVGQALLLYANENRGHFPRGAYKVGDAPTAYTGVESKDPFAKEGAPMPNDVTAALFLLIRTQDITPEVFICPSSGAEKYNFGKEGRKAQDVSNFADEAGLSYSYANPYPAMEAVAQGYRLNAAVSAEFAVAADMNPGNAAESDPSSAKGPKDENAAADVMKKANSLNHRSEGQNVLYGDGHVDWQTTPFCGMKKDNIYTVSGANDGSKTTSDKITGSPTWAGDSVLLPTATKDPHKKTLAEEELAAVQEFKAMLPKLQEMVKEEEKKDPNSPRLKMMKEQLGAMEREMAEIEAKNKK